MNEPMCGRDLVMFQMSLVGNICTVDSVITHSTLFSVRVMWWMGMGDKKGRKHKEADLAPAEHYGLRQSMGNDSHGL